MDTENLKNCRLAICLSTFCLNDHTNLPTDLKRVCLGFWRDESEPVGRPGSRMRIPRESHAQKIALGIGDEDSGQQVARAGNVRSVQEEHCRRQNVALMRILKDMS